MTFSALLKMTSSVNMSGLKIGGTWTIQCGVINIKQSVALHFLFATWSVFCVIQVILAKLCFPTQVMLCAVKVMLRSARITTTDLAVSLF